MHLLATRTALHSLLCAAHCARRTRGSPGVAAGRGPLVAGRCAVSLPSAVPGRMAAPPAFDASAAAAACMRSMRASSLLNF